MIWQDILVERDVTDAEISAAIANAFALAPAVIAVVSELMEIDESRIQTIEVACERWRAAGDFAIHMHIYLRSDESIALTRRLGDVEIIGRLAVALNSACFVSDDDINPFTGLLVRGPHDVQPARLDPAAEDEGVFRLAPVPAHIN